MTSSCCTSDLDCSQLLRGPQYLDNGASDENAAGALEAETPFDTAAKTPIVAGTAVCVNGAQLTPPTASTAGHDSTAAAADDSDSPSPQQADDLQSLLARLQGRSEEESALVQARLLAAAEAAPAPSPRGRAASSRAPRQQPQRRRVRRWRQKHWRRQRPPHRPAPAASEHTGRWCSCAEGAVQFEHAHGCAAAAGQW